MKLQLGNQPGKYFNILYFSSISWSNIHSITHDVTNTAKHEACIS